MKKIGKILLWFIGIVAFLLIGVVIAFKVSVKPGVYIIQKMFDQPVTIMDEAAYEKAVAVTEKIKDVQYASTYDENTLDIYYPKDIDEAFPVLFWVHGGGFVGGNKEGVEEFATYIAAKNEIAVVAINYEKAPTLQYPGQVKQLEDVYKDLGNRHEEFPMLDFSSVLFGGDSAGAQIAAQFVALQTNEDYAKEMDIDQIVPQESLRVFISYSGPVDIQQMKNVKSDDRFMKFFVNTVARAFIGTKDWQDSEAIQQASVKEYITKDFPPTYITDGNAFSFQEQGMAFEEQLKSFDIPVQSLFFKDVDHEIPHEYQFNYTLEEARESLQQTIDFIQMYVKE